jgi:23S rRNA pseudouridine1911/1915/1917 synthase
MKQVACLTPRTIRIDPLPGSEPYDNVRTMRVRQQHDGLTLIDFLHQLHPPTPPQHWLTWIAEAAITLDGHPVVTVQTVHAGECFNHRMPQTVEPDVACQIEMVHEDDAILVVNKPAPLPVHPSGRFNRNTLTEFLRPHYPEQRLRIAHRLDANTTGLVLLCRTHEAAGFVQPQFEQRTVAKAYVALVRGIIPWDRHRCESPIGPAAELDGLADTRGARIVHPDGQPAETHFEVIRRLANQTTLVKAVPITGRTNQIRVHLWSLGFPIQGDPLYQCDERLGKQQTLAVGQSPMCLHARQLTFTHPGTRQTVTFTQPASFENEVL